MLAWGGHANVDGVPAGLDLRRLVGGIVVPHEVHVRPSAISASADLAANETGLSRPIPSKGGQIVQLSGNLRIEFTMPRSSTGN